MPWPGNSPWMTWSGRAASWCAVGRAAARPTIDKGARWKSGWRYQRHDTRGGRFVGQWANLPEALLLFAERMLQVQIESDDAIRVIRRFDAPRTLTLADPPYLPDLRSKWAGKAYEVEMSADDHGALADVMCGLAGYGLICGYPSELYRDLYEARGWRREEKRSLDGAGNRRTEAIWISPRTQAALTQEHGPLFGGRL